MPKKKKPRPGKYAGKVKLNTNLSDTLKLFATAAGKNLKDGTAGTPKDEDPSTGSLDNNA